jgi:aspartate carbamoyltransferase catalytic subunit
VTQLNSQHLLSTDELGLNDINLILNASKYVEDNISKGIDLPLLKGKILATLFFEPSTRTRLSFETAMTKLGGSVITVESGGSTSAMKGETLEDMGKVISGYADIIVTRHPDPFSVDKLSSTSDVPVINAGDGPNQHPSQALLDLYTISREKGKLENLKIGLLGDLKFGRTVHSLCSLLNLFPIHFVFISHPSLKMPAHIVDKLRSEGHRVDEVSDLEAAIEDLDVLYVTRVQGERFEDEKTYLQVRDRYQVNNEILRNAKLDLCIMHPLPRINEIHTEIDSDPRAKYFKQAKNGVYVRMAILGLLLGKVEVPEKTLIGTSS